MLRDFLDDILGFIESESLTDEEFTSIEDLDPVIVEEYSKETYLALKTVIENREGVSGQAKRLKLYFIAKGVDLSDSGSTKTASSNIFIGKPL